MNQNKNTINTNTTNNENEKILKRVSTYHINQVHPLFTYCDDMTFKSKNLKNLANYHVRRCFIFHNRENIPTEVQDYFNEMNQYIDQFNKITNQFFRSKKLNKLIELRKKRNELKYSSKQKELDDIKKDIQKELNKKYIPQPNISKDSGLLFYDFLNYYFRYCLNTEDNPYKLLPAQAAQQVLRNVNKDWKGFCKSIKEYSISPSKFTGKPDLPKYKKKNGRCKISFTNQQCKIIDGFVTLPFTKLKLKVGFDCSDLKLKEVRVIPMGVNYKIELIWDIKIFVKNDDLNKNAYLGIDLGVSNLATLTNNIGLNPIIINGRPLKSINQYYNKKRAELQSNLPFIRKNDGSFEQLHWSKTLSELTQKRNNKIENAMHTVSKYIINYCKTNKIKTIVIGLNNNWKDQINLGTKTNQNFVEIPFKTLINQIIYKSEEVGITVIVREESYTSKASFVDLDDIPTYQKNKKINCNFSGIRKYRGLYISKNRKYINADVNGSYNILRKEFPHLFTPETIKHLSFKPEVVNIIKN